MTMVTVDELFTKATPIPPDTLDRLTSLGRCMKRGTVEWPRGAHMPEWHEAKKVASRLEVATTYDARTMFLDAYGVPVGYRTDDGEYTKVPAWAQVLWALMTGDIVADKRRPVYPSEDAQEAAEAEGAAVVATRLYRRDADMTCSQVRQQTWHEITDVQDELGIHKPSDRLANLDLWCRALARQSGEWLHHAILLRGRHGMWRMWERVNGSVREFGGDDSTTPPPCDVVLRIGGEDLEAGIAEAGRWVRWLCKTEDSAYNLSRWFAAPICAKYAHLAFILYGAGGNGKSLLFKELNAALGTRVAPLSTDALTGRTTAFEQGQALLPIIGALWATLDENGSGEYDTNPVVKKLATGEPVHMRGVQKNMVSYRPVCTLAFGTNVPPREGEASFNRRFAIVDMVDGREAEDFEGLLDFLRNRHGIAMMLAYSARHWGGIPPQEPGSVPPSDGIVGAGGGADMKMVRIIDTTTDPMADGALSLVAHLLGKFPGNPTGAWVKAADVPGIVGVRELSRYARRQLMQTLGMEATSRRLGGAVARVWRVADGELSHDKFMQYWNRADAEASEPDLSPVAKHAPAPTQLVPDGDELLTPGDLGFGAKYWPCGHDKVSRGWQQAYKNGTAHTTEADVYTPGGAYAVIPTDGYCIVDCDIVKSDPAARTGYDMLYELLGGEPDTTMVLTPSGGVHAYYKLPDGLRLANAVNVGGSHIDLRVAGLGYVVGVLSTTDAGMYKPANQKHVGVMPAELVAWLRENGAVAAGTEAEVEAEAHTVDTEAAAPANDTASALDGLNPFGGLTHFGGDDRTGPVDDWVVTRPTQVTAGHRHGPVLEWSLRLIGDAADRHATEAQMAGLVRKMWSTLGEYAEGAERARDTRLIFRGALKRFGYPETILNTVGRD